MDKLAKVMCASEEIEDRFEIMFNELLRIFPDGNPINKDEVYNNIPNSQRFRLEELYRKHREEKFREADKIISKQYGDCELAGSARVGGKWAYSFYIQGTEKTVDVVV